MSEPGRRGLVYVSSLAAMPDHARELAPERLVSIIQPEFQPPTPPGIERHAHHRLAVHDIVYPGHGQILADAEGVAQLIEFLDGWRGHAPLLVHCYAGISRSTATALVAHVMKSGDPEGAGRQLRTAAPHAAPNRHIIDIADSLLGLNGTLVDAVAAMGAPDVSLLEAPLTRLDVPLR